jgi:hypothetical protein
VRSAAEQRVAADEAGASDGASPLNSVFCGLKEEDDGRGAQTGA